MLDTTIRAVETVCAMDPSIDRARLRDALRVIAGEVAVAGVSDVDDRAVSRKEAARIMGVCPQTVSLYVRRGLIRPIRFGIKGERASGYSMRSIKAAMAK